jgi:chloride channel protein, CIC family
MLAAMIADITAISFLGDKPFLSGFPSGIELHHARTYLLIAVLAVVAALMGLAFKAVLYKTEDLCERVWKGRPEWARPAVGGIALGLLLLAIPQMYGVGYPVMYKATAGQYALWFLVVLAFAKIAACSLTIGIGGSGGVFAPSLFVGVTSGTAFGDVAPHIFGAAAGQPALYAVVAMGAVFASAARAPLTSLASVVEMTGDFALTLPVMLAVAIAAAVSRSLSYGTIYTTKLLRRGTDIDRTTLWRALADLKIADAMRPFRPPLPVPPPAPAGADGGGTAPDSAGLPGPVSHRVRRPGPAAAGGLWPRRPARPVRRRPADTRLGHRTRRAPRHRPPDHHRPGPGRPGPGRRRLGPRRPGNAPAPPADPAARLPVHRDRRHRRLARRRAHPR